MGMEIVHMAGKLRHSVFAIVAASLLLTLPVLVQAAAYGDDSYGAGGYGDGSGNASPSVSLTAPADGATYTVGDTVSFAATATDSDGAITSVTFFVDGSSIGSDTTSAYTDSWTAAGTGSHTLLASAVDDEGSHATSSSVTITVAAASSGSSGGGGGGGSSRPRTPTTSTPTPTPTTPTTSGPTTPSPAAGGGTSGSTGSTYVRDLTVGSTGGDVLSLQQLLIMKGFLAAGNTTGYFGLLTKGALAAYQASQGIVPAEGYLGPKTRASLAGAIVPTTPVVPVTPSTPTPSPAPSMAPVTRDLQLGAVGEDVRRLQQALNAAGYPVSLEGAGSAGFESTVFGPATRAAVIRFQLGNNIEPAAGYVGARTRAVLAAQGYL